MSATIKVLSVIRGNGTTLVTIYIPGGQAISITSQKIAAELATADRIKSKDTRHAVCTALKSLKARLGSYRDYNAPENGLALFASDEICEMIENLPLRVKTFAYKCDKVFHLEPLESMLVDGQCFGFIVFDGSGCTIASVAGSTVTKLGSLVAHLPKKHGKGGQSAPRFQHTRLEQRIVFRKKVESLARQLLIGPDHKAICKGIVIAGSSTFKGELELDGRLTPLILGTVTVQYSGMNGLYEAIDKTRDLLDATSLYEEIDILRSFFEAIDTNKPVCFGAKHVAQAILGSAVDTLILSEEWAGAKLVTAADGTVKIVVDGDTGVDLEDLVKIRVVSASSREGAQFCQGFGIGAFLRYPIDLVFEDDADEEAEFA